MTERTRGGGRKGEKMLCRNRHYRRKGKGEMEVGVVKREGRRKKKETK